MLFCNWGWAQQEALGGQEGIENTIFNVYDMNSTKSNEKPGLENSCAPGLLIQAGTATKHYLFTRPARCSVRCAAICSPGIILANVLPLKGTIFYPNNLMPPASCQTPLMHPQLPSYLSSPTHNSTNRLAPITSPSLNSAATSTFNGLSTSGHPNNILTARTHSKTLYVGVHASFNRSKQISPVSNATFACTTGVANAILGGCKGYVGGMAMRRSQRPSVTPSHTVSLEWRGGWGGGGLPS